LLNKAAPARPVPTFSQGAGPGGLLLSAAGMPTDELVRQRNQLLDQLKTQYLSSTTGELFVFWNPDAPPPYDVEMDQHGKIIARLEVRDEVDATLQLPIPLDLNQGVMLTVRAGGRVIRTFAITVVESTQEPLAPGLSPADRNDTRAATLQGLWLLTEGGIKWRLQAMAHLRKSASANQDFVAARVLRALISGEWEPP
jgi:hypothetical protein